MDTDRPTALVVEDDRAIRLSVRALLVGQGWSVDDAATIAEGQAAAQAKRYDLVIVDLGLPDGDGVALIARLRRLSAVPVIVLSARLDEAQKIRALDAGADDYVEKPFRLGEFAARVRAQARRRAASASDAALTLTFGDVEFDDHTRAVRKAGSDVHLTPTEYRLFRHLVRHAGRVLTHRQLLKEVWGADRVEHPHVLRVFMAALRQKLEDDPSRPKLILTETGVGYRLPAP